MGSLLLVSIALMSALAAPAPPAAALMPGPRDYTFMWWAYGWRGRSPDNRKVLCIQTGRYGVAIDTERVELLRLGAIAVAKPYAEAVAQDNAVVLALPSAALELKVTSGGKEYRCVRCDLSAEDQLGYPMRMVESGRFVQRAYIDHLVFRNRDGDTLPIRARLEIVAWPDRVSFLLDATPERELADGTPAVNTTLVETRQTMSGASSASGAWKPGDSRTAWSTVRFGAAEDAAVVTVRASALPGGATAPVTYDAARGWHSVALPAEPWGEADNISHLERAQVTLANTSGSEQQVHLLLAKDYGFPGITGFTPMLRDAEGNPTGIPVQLSKDWHRTPGRPFAYEGPWFHGFTLLTLPAHSTQTLEFDIAYGFWGKAPVASHAQLSLIGYGVNQLWEQSAIGSWGESICYDPDVNLNRSVIDDVRPLMVWQIGHPGAKWSWTNNAGGGDFLVYFDARNQKQYLSRMRTAYLSQGPCLTDVVYAGVSADDRIAARIEVRLPRTDDLVRGYHRFRYEVRKPVQFSRLAFYQVGADHYNEPPFDKLARGTAAGLTREWSFAKGGKRYDRAGVALTGVAPWLSLHAGTNPDTKGGGYATRGLIVRSWRARLGGKDVPAPYAAFFGTEDGKPGMNAELAPPPGLTELLPGDFVEAEVELIIVPMTAAEYYGPNENLRKALVAGANTWKPIHREAARGAVDVKVAHGTLQRRLPIAVRVAPDQTAALDVTGGLGFVPVTFTGLRDYRGAELRLTAGRKSSIVGAPGFWQTDYDPVAHTWSLTYNVPLDSPNDIRRTVRLELMRTK